MSVTLNAKGTSVPSFTIGKGGVTIYQGLTDPSLSYSMKDGDYWLDKSANSMKVWTVVGLTWQAPRLADLHFVDSSIIAPGGQDLTLSVDTNHYVNIDSGISGPALITTNNSQDLHINPATGGGQNLILCGDRWPSSDGATGQTLVTDGHGTLGWSAMGLSSNSLIAPPGQNLVLSIDANRYVTIDSGNSGPALITTSNSQDLHINPAWGGGQYLVLCGNRWPAIDGINGQSLVTNGNGTLSWYTPPVGTVTSISVDGGSTGLTFGGSPITSSGTLTLAGTLSVFNGGTGATSSTNAFNNLVPSQVTNDGKFLTTNGTDTSWNNIVTSGTATIDFGSSPGGLSASVAVTGLTHIYSTSVVILQIMADATSLDHSAAEHRAFTTYANLTYDTPVTGSGFTIYSDASQLVQGRWTVKYSWLNSN